MTDNEGVRVTSADIYNQLIAFRKEFGDYLKEQGPKMALLEYKVQELEEKLESLDKERASERALLHTEKQNRKLYLWSFAGSSVALEIINWIAFHK